MFVNMLYRRVMAVVFRCGLWKRGIAIEMAQMVRGTDNGSYVTSGSRQHECADQDDQANSRGSPQRPGTQSSLDT